MIRLVVTGIAVRIDSLTAYRVDYAAILTPKIRSKLSAEDQVYEDRW